MTILRAYTYNSGNTISGTTQTGDIAIQTGDVNFQDGHEWFNGPDEELGYVICSIYPNIIQKNLVLNLDASNDVSFRGEPTTNLATSDLSVVQAGTFIQNTTVDSVRILENNTVDNSHVMWNGAAGFNVICDIGEYITVSAYYRTNFQTQMRLRDKSGNGHITTTNVNIPNTNGEWLRFSATSLVNVTNPDCWWYNSDYRVFNEFGLLEMKKFQIEVKPYATPFVDGTRGTTCETGGGWCDLSNNDNNGALSNQTYDSGSIVFDGTDHITVTEIGSLKVFTIECWFKPTSYPNNNACVISSVYPGNNNTVNFRIGYDNGTTMRGGIYNPVDNWKYSNSIPTSLGVWQQAIFTYDGQYFILYNNGISSGSVEFVESPGFPASSGDGIRIGRRWDSAEYFSGNIASCRIYNKALTTKEILQNFNSNREKFGFDEYDIIEDGLILNLDAGDSNSYPGSGNIWYDLSGNDHHVYGSPGVAGSGYTDANFPVYQSDNDGRFYFDGTDGFTILTDMGNHTNLTMDFWCYRITSSSSRYFFDARNDGGSWVLSNYTDGNINVHNALKTNDPATYSTTSNWWNKWINVVITSNSSGSAIFINDENITDDRLISSASINENLGQYFRIGCRYTSAGSWLGYFSNIRFYDRVLSKNEITRNYNARKGRFGL